MNGRDQAGSDKFPPLPGFGSGNQEGAEDAQARPNITPDLESAPNRSAVGSESPKGEASEEAVSSDTASPPDAASAASPPQAEADPGDPAESADDPLGGPLGRIDDQAEAPGAGHDSRDDLPPFGRFGEPSPTGEESGSREARGLPPLIEDGPPPPPAGAEMEQSADDPSNPQATTRRATNDPFIGKTFLGYTIVEGIGQGGMGMVYKGRQASLDRDVAIKMLNKALVDNEEFIKRFEREAKSMANVHHPNIVSVIDFGEQDGIYFMVAEYVEGTNLSKMIRQQLMVPAAELAPIMIQCLSGLDYVAKSNVVHRDIKPDNILIDKDGVAKIADFGLAKDFSKEETDLTAAGSAMGTPSYMSPEQCMGRPLDVRSDIYSFGVTAYYALTGEKPFTGQSSFEIMTKQREHVPPPPHQINPQVPREVAEVVMRMLEKDPSKRFENAEFCRDTWVQVSQELGLLGSVTRSGEYFFVDGSHESGPQVSRGGEAGAAGPANLGVNYPGADDAPMVPDLHLTGANDVAPEPPAAAAQPPSPPAGGVQTGLGSSSVEVDSVKSDTEKHSTSHVRKRGTGTARDRRGSSRLTDRKDNTSPVTLVQADALFRQGKFRKAAEAYGKLAEQEQDRKKRSILRTKEREARKRDSEQGSVVNNRIKELVEQGQYKNALKMLEDARQSSASSVVDKRFSNEILRLRGLMQKRRRRIRIIVMLLLLGAIGAAGYFFQDQVGDFLRDIAFPGADEAGGGGDSPDATDGEQDPVDGPTGGGGP